MRRSEKRRIDRRRAAPCPREEGRYKWKGVEYELTTPSMLLKIINSVDDSKDGHYYPLGRFLAEDDGIWVAVDNECGCAWTEEFYNKTVALNWLCTSMYGDTERAHEVDRATTARNETIRAKEEELRRRPSWLTYIQSKKYWTCTNCNYLEGRR